MASRSLQGFLFVQFPKGKHTQASAVQLVPINIEPLVQKKKKNIFIFEMEAYSQEMSG